MRVPPGSTNWRSGGSSASHASMARLEPRRPRGVDGGMAERAFALVRRRELGADAEQLVLHARELQVDLRDPRRCARTAPSAAFSSSTSP